MCDVCGYVCVRRNDVVDVMIMCVMMMLLLWMSLLCVDVIVCVFVRMCDCVCG